jgi:L,D-peptidoglycan transpeptidase YkuD (ErfK/YbiS/YcfS/YnhG family)
MVLVLAALLAGCGSPASPTPSAQKDHPRHLGYAPVSESPPPSSAPPTSAPATTTTSPPTTGVPVSTTTFPSGCSPSLAGQLSSTGHATQLVTVVASSYTSTYATLTAWQREGPCWVPTLGPWTARVGYAGFSNHHVEGDGTTPTGAYGVEPVMYGNAPNPGVRYPYKQLVCGDWWDETPSTPEYNTFQYVPCGQSPPFGGGSEALWTETTAYPSFAVVEYSTTPVIPGAGSAIFIHADVGSATDGCVSLPLAELDRLLTWLDPASAPLIVMGPSSEIESF